MAVLFCCSADLSAQQINPALANTLNQLQNGNGLGQNGLGLGLGLGQNQVLGAQQQDLQSVTQLPASVQRSALPASRLEQIMSARAGATLREFGYDQLGVGRPVTIPQVGAVQDDYILGAGDEIVVSLRGQENSDLPATVNRNGQVLLPRLDPLAASGRSFGAFRQDLEAAARRAYIATSASATIARVRQITVLISGEVNVPGQRILTGLSSVVDAILLSGGVKKTGSLRNIRIERGGVIIPADLYTVLTNTGRAGETRLTDGDRIMVPALGKTLAVSGLVRQPGIFELPPGRSGMPVRELMALSGGMEVRGQYRLSVLRVAANGATHMEKLAGETATVDDSEILFVDIGADLVTNQAQLSGNTGLAGQFPIVTGTRLSEMLKAPGALGPAPYTLFGIIARRNPQTLLRQLLTFTPVAVLNGREDQVLQNDDIIRVLSVNEARLLTNTVRIYNQRQTEAQDAVRNPLAVPDQPTTQTVVSPTGQLTQVPVQPRNPQNTLAVLDLADQQRQDISRIAEQVDPVTRQTMQAQADAQRQQFGQQQDSFQQQNPQVASASSSMPGQQTPPLVDSETGLAITNVGGANPVLRDGPSMMSAPPVPSLNFQSADTLSGQIARNREVANFADLARQLGVDQLVLVNYLIDHQALLSGAVGGPGYYFVGPNVGLQDLVQAAGGTMNWADESGVELISTAVDTQSGRSATRRVQLPLRQGMLANYIVQPRDQLRFNKVFTDSGLGTATIQGEVRFTGSYQITRGEHLSDLLARAGGLTSTAYPYGTVFLRKSAAETERDGYVRAAREIEEQLVVAMTRIGNDKIDPATFGSMQAFVNELRNQKAVGRISVPADPSLLAANPQRDPLLEPGDVVYIPQRPSTIAVLGQVSQAGNYPYRAGQSLGEYIDMAGGYGANADGSRTFIVLPDGSARKVEKSWLRFDTDALPPGSTIVVPRDVTPLDTRQLIMDVTAIFSQLAVSVASLAVISR